MFIDITADVEPVETAGVQATEAIETEAHPEASPDDVTETTHTEPEMTLEMV